MSTHGLSQEFKNIAALKFTAADRGHHPLHIHGASLGRCSEAGFSPDDVAANRPFGKIVGRLNAWRVHESPQGCFELQDALARMGCLGVTLHNTALQSGFHLHLKGSHVTLKLFSTQATNPNPMPTAEHPLAVVQQVLPHLPGNSAALGNPGDMPQ